MRKLAIILLLFTAANLFAREGFDSDGEHLVITINGVAYVITNEPAFANDVLKFTPANTTAYFAAESGGGTEQGTYPVFKLDIGNIDGNWTDFEIKATTNNFDSLVYYYKSWTTNTGGNPDTNAYVFFTDDYATDVRQWFCKTNNTAISEHLLSEDSVVHAVYFYPSHDCTWSNWMSATNSALVWSWVRVDDLGFEQNVDESKQLWSAIQPVEWVTARPTGLPWGEICTNPAASTASSDEYFGTIFVTNKIYLGATTNAPWIIGLGTTNIQFGAGTNRAIFGSPW